jgi:urea transporter
LSSALENKVAIHFEGLLHSYSQLFFAKSKWYGLLLILISFANPQIGISGLLAVIITNLIADISSLNAASIKEGLYGFCSAMVGMGLGAFFQINAFFFVLLFLTALLSLLLTLGFQGFLNKINLPYLSFPFLICFWLILLAARVFTQLHYSAGYYISNTFYFDFVNDVNHVQLPEIMITFFRSLGSIFFQSNVLVGVLIAVGLFFYSRISFSLAVLGFASAYVFYFIAGINTGDLNELFVGSNYILTAIAIGGFFIIPNTYSYLVVMIVIPLVALVNYGLSNVLGIFHLPAYTISFTLTTLLFLYLLKWRLQIKYLHPVTVQYSSPEKNLYHFLANSYNYRYSKYYPLSLPYMSEWLVSQGHNGKITHLGDWSKAFDFIILDDELKSYQSHGDSLEDFYCYGKPVLAPGDGYVVNISDNIVDNLIADVNIKDNWGNSIIIDHKNGLYSQLSHLKKLSFKVKMGDYVKRGDLIASCGNSGRSPEPHLHFQLQLSNEIGAKTLDYPIGSYILRNNDKYELKTFEKPKEGEFISNVEINTLLKKAFNLIPGAKLNWEWKGEKESWEVFTDEWNRTYIYCKEKRTIAWFANDGVVFRFSDFEGNKNTFLYHFFVGCNKVFLGYYQDLELKENYPITFKNNILFGYIQDITAPFFQMVKADYSLKYLNASGFSNSDSIEMESKSRSRIGNYTLKSITCKIILNEKGIKEFIISDGTKKTIATCIEVS